MNARVPPPHGSGKPFKLPRGTKLRSDQQFLPGALEVLETPPAPLAYVMILTLIAFFTIAVTWAYFGRIDIIAVAQGKVQPSGNVKTVQSLETGRIVVNRSENGKHVKAGDLLFGLDPREAVAERRTVEADLMANRAEVSRRLAAIDAARAGSFEPSVTWSDETLLPIRRREERVLMADLSHLESQMALSASQIVQKSAERQKLTSTIEAQKSLILTLQQRVDMRDALKGTNSFSKSNYLDSIEALRSQQTTLVQEVGQIGEIDANLEVIRRDSRQTLRNFVADNSQKLDEAERQVASLTEKLALANAKIENLAIDSPIDGVVQSLILTSAGQVVSPGQEVMRIVPDGAALEIQSYLPNKDIAFVAVGQKAIVKITSVPFTRYGTIDAIVTRVDHDAIPEPDADQSEQDPSHVRRSGMSTGADRVQNLVYAVTLKPLRTTIDVDGTAVALGPGMEVTTEIRTGTRRIIDYLFSPLQQMRSEALRER